MYRRFCLRWEEQEQFFSSLSYQCLPCFRVRHSFQKMSLRSEEAGNSASAEPVPAVPPPEPTLASVLQCMVTLQRQHNQLAEAVQRLAPPSQSTLPAGTQASISPAATPMDQTNSPSDAGIGGSPSSCPPVTFSGVPSSSGSGSGELCGNVYSTWIVCILCILS